MWLDGATAKNNKNIFIKRIVESETIFYLSKDGGVANSVSNDDDECIILMFWSDKAYAKRVQANGFASYEISEIMLFDFLYRWLPGMTNDNVLAGVNWNQELCGRELDPFELREEIELQMSSERLEEYDKIYKSLINSE